MPDQSEAWPWGHDRPGASEWRQNIVDPKRDEQRLLESVTEALRNAPHPGGRVLVEDAHLQGSFPLTELVVVFRLEPRFPGRHLAYKAWVWDDPDSHHLFMMYFDEALNDFAQGHTAADLGAMPEGVLWLTEPATDG